MDELKRIKLAYERRKKNIPHDYYSFFTPDYLFSVQRRDRNLINILKNRGITSLTDKKILDVGCGTGGELRNLIRYGAKSENLFGIDLLEERISAAREINPNVKLIGGDASKLAFEINSFDIIMQFTLFSSIFDKKLKKKIAENMVKLLKPDGLIIWYDFHMNNPRNPDVRGIKRKEIYELFPDCIIDLKRVTLAPPITRKIANNFWILCYILESLRIFNTHYLGVIKLK